MPFVEAAMAGFKQGVESAPTNPLGVFLRGILERANTLRDLQMQSQMRVQEAVETKKQTLPYELELEQAKAKSRSDSIEDIFAESKARSLGKTAGLEDRGAQKALADLQARSRELDLSERGITSLFKRAKSSVPPISGVGALPGIMPLAQAGRAAQIFTGGAESTRGFIDTFPVEARKQLRTLEKGGRFTDKDIEQIIRAATPGFQETATRRSAKEAELLNKIKEERRVVQEQLSALKGGESSQESEFIEGESYEDAQGNQVTYRNGQFIPR